MPSSLASLRTGGAACTGSARGAPAQHRSCPARRSPSARPRDRTRGPGCRRARCPVSGTSSRRGAPTGTMSPTSRAEAHDRARGGHRELDLRLVGLHVGDDLVAGARGRPPRPATARARPPSSPRRGRGGGRASIPGLGSSGIERGLERGDDARRRRAGTSPRRAAAAEPTSYAGDPPDRRLERPERLLLHGGDDLGAEARGERRLVHDDDATGAARSRATIVSTSSGASVRRSTTPTCAPRCSRAASEAASATSTIAPHAMIDRVAPVAHDVARDRAARGARRRARRPTCGSTGSART